MNTEEKKLTGYPSIDKPWLKYYSEEVINAPLPIGSMYDFMCDCNKERQNEPALNYFGKKILHRHLRENIDICARALVANAVKPGDFVALCLLAIPEVVYLLYAVNRIGAISNFLVLSATEEELHKQISLCGSKLLITMDIVEDKIGNAVKGTAIEKVVAVSVPESMPVPLSTLMKLKSRKPRHIKTISWRAFLNSGKKSELPEDIAGDQDSAVVEYTGGTTGESKGVLPSNQAANTLAFHYLNLKTMLHFQAGETFLNIIPPFLAYGLFLGIHMPLCVGTECILSPDPAPQSFPKLFVKYKPNHFSGGPLHIDNLIQHLSAKRLNLSFLITAAYGGDSSGDEWERKASSFFRQNHAKYGLVNGYGMTEVAGAFCTTSHEIRHMIPFAKNNVKIIDIDTGKELSYGQEGEICISGPTMMKEYYKNEEETSDAIWVENGVRWLHTGDLGYITEEGYFVIRGRLKRIFYSVGSDTIINRVYPMKIESTICKCAYVDKCTVVGKPNGEKGYLPIAFIVLQENVDENMILAKLRAICREELPEASWPCMYRCIDKLPTTPTGKVDYRALERMAEQETENLCLS